MSFLGGLFGISQPPAQKQDEPSASSDLLNSTQFRSNVGSSSSASASASSSGIYSEPTTTDADLAAPPPSYPQEPQAPSASAMLSGQFDVGKLHPMADLGENLDFLNLDDEKLSELDGAGSVLPSRGWTDDLCVGTGTTYLSGLVIGGAWGLKEGLSRPLGANPSFRLRLNNVLNSCTRRGTFTGNSLGVLAIYYNLTNSAIDSFRNKHDPLNSMGAGAITGALYKCTAGFRPMLVGAAIGTGAMGAWEGFKKFV